MKPVRLAVVGAGKLGGYHANIASNSENFELVAVIDPSEAARNALAEKTGAKALAEYQDLPESVDAAVVATPTSTHRETTVALLDRGLHVLVEKPLAPTLAEANAMVAAAEKNECLLQVGHVERFNPALEAIPEPIVAPRYIEATRTSGYTFRSTDIGAVLDLMIHDIDLVLAFARSEVVHVEAMGVNVLGLGGEEEHEDMVTAQLHFENGCVARLTASRVSYALQREMKIFSATGFVALDFAQGRATTVRPTAEVLSRRWDPEALTPEQKGELFAGKMFEEVLIRQEHEAPAGNAIELELDDFAQAIRTGVAPRVTGSDGRDAVAIAEQIIASVRQHAWDRSPTGRTGPFLQREAPLRKSA